MVARTMSDTPDETPNDVESTTSQRPPSDPLGPDQVGADAVGGDAPVSTDAASTGEPKDPLELAKADAQRFREQLLRTAADFDNFRKRARREADDAGRRGRETS
jgi:molecular chaperone GrpE